MTEATLERIKLPHDEVVAALDEAVATKGEDYAYIKQDLGEPCLYFDLETGEPKCLVGFVFHKLGYTLADLTRVRRAHGWEHVGMLPAKERVNRCAFPIFDKTMFDAELRTLRLLTVAQSYQDNREPWGHAVRRGKEAAEAVEQEEAADE